MIIAGTGHRKFKHFDYQDLLILAKHQLKLEKPDCVVSGMAVGFDMALAHAAISLGIPFLAAVPFEGQEKKWPQELQDEYWNTLRKAKRVKIVCDGGYEPWKFQRRNEYMVDICQKLLAAWSGQCKGGTYNCIKYAIREQVDVKLIPELLVGSLEQQA